MARERIGGRTVLVQFGAGIVERIDDKAGSGRRAEFIRSAVETALGVVASVETPAAKVSVPARPSVPAADARRKAFEDQRRDDVAALLSALRVRPMSERQLVDALGWQEMRVSKVIGWALAAGLAVSRGNGMLEEK